MGNPEAEIDKFLRRNVLEEMTGLSRSTIYAKLDPNSPQHDPDFPKAVRIGPRAVAWRASEVIAWMNSRESTAA